MKAKITTALLIIFGAFLVFQSISKSQEIKSTFENATIFSQDKISYLQKLSRDSNAIVLTSRPTDPVSSSSIKTVETLMSEYNTSSNEDLRNTIQRISKSLEDHALINKSNSGQITTLEKTELILIVRLNTALNRILINRALETSRR